MSEIHDFPTEHATSVTSRQCESLIEREEREHPVTMRLARELGDSEAAIERIRELHYDDRGYCAHCEHKLNFVPYPCRTIRALDAPPPRRRVNAGELP